MSWDGYVTSLCNYEDVNEAAVCDNRGNSGTLAQLTALASAISGDATSVNLGDVKYMILNKDPEGGTLQGKKGNCGISVATSGSAMIVAMHVHRGDGEVAQGLNQRLMTAAMNTAEYLRSLNM